MSEEGYVMPPIIDGEYKVLTLENCPNCENRVCNRCKWGTIDTPQEPE